MEKQFEITNDMLATAGQRFVNYIIDGIVVYLILFILIIFKFLTLTY